MSLESSLSWAPDLTDAIDSQPLVMLPSDRLSKAIALLSQEPFHRQSMSAETNVSVPHRSGCALVLKANKVVGILTERDLVRLTADNVDFASTTVATVMVKPVVTLPCSSANDIFAALFLFRRYRIRHLPIVDEQEHLMGVVTHESIRKILRPANLLQFRRVADVMISDVVHASPSVSILALAKLMTKHRVSCVVLVEQYEEQVQPVGIVTERDMVQYQALGLNLNETKAEDVMSAPLFLLSPEDSLWTAHQEMQRRRVGRLVVSWNWGQGLGIVTQTSLLKVFDPLEMYGVIENLQQTIAQLREERQGLRKKYSFSAFYRDDPSSAKTPAKISNPGDSLSEVGANILSVNESASTPEMIAHLHEFLYQMSCSAQFDTDSLDYNIKCAQNTLHRLSERLGLPEE